MPAGNGMGPDPSTSAGLLQNVLDPVPRCPMQKASTIAPTIKRKPTVAPTPMPAAAPVLKPPPPFPPPPPLRLSPLPGSAPGLPPPPPLGLPSEVLLCEGSEVPGGVEVLEEPETDGL